MNVAEMQMLRWMCGTILNMGENDSKQIYGSWHFDIGGVSIEVNGVKRFMQLTFQPKKNYIGFGVNFVIMVVHIYCWCSCCGEG